mgnify:CR=1 FL=1
MLDISLSAATSRCVAANHGGRGGRDGDIYRINGQYYDIASIPEMGGVSAALAVERLAQLPFTGEAAVSMLVSPQKATIGQLFGD